MKIKLLWVGKPDSDVWDSALQQYLQKIKFYSPFEVIAIPYLKNTKSFSIDEQKRKEGDLILKNIIPADFVVLLDERGQEYTSEDFADFIQRQANSGLKTLVFVIGGAYGFSPALYERQNARIALSKMTFPHILTRVVFAEQLYRAFTILYHEPYHH